MSDVYAFSWCIRCGWSCPYRRSGKPAMMCRHCLMRSSYGSNTDSYEPIFPTFFRDPYLRQADEKEDQA